jgi:predicted DNA-binding transcriptional regulator AlpA
MSERSGGVRWLKIDQMCERYGGVSRNTITANVTRGELPEPILLGNWLMWKESECDEYDERNRAAQKAKRGRLAKSREGAIKAAHAARKRSPCVTPSLTTESEPQSPRADLDSSGVTD